MSIRIQLGPWGAIEAVKSRHFSKSIGGSYVNIVMTLQEAIMEGRMDADERLCEKVIKC